MEKEKHIAVHRELHKNLDQLVADHIACTGKLPSRTSLMDLMEWSYQQTIDPAEPKI